MWLQIKMEMSSESTKIHGIQDIDFDWMKAVRSVNPEIKIVPRIIFDSWSGDELAHLMEDPKLPASVGKQMADLAKVLITG